jgi:glycosyltransferase involved in cell wall biosynthesis
LVPPGFEKGSDPDQIAGVTVVRIESAGVTPMFPGAVRGSWVQRRLRQVKEWNRSGVNRELDRVLADFQPEVVHTALVFGFGAGVWKVAGRYPLVHTLRDYYLICGRSDVMRGEVPCESQCTDCRIVTAPMRKAVCSHAALIAGISGDIVRRHVEWRAIRGPVRTTIVYNRPKLAAPSRVRTTAGRTVGYLGRVGVDKGTYVLVQAIAMVDDPELRLVVAGGGQPDDLDRLRAAADRDPRINYVGVQDAADFLSSVDIVAVPAQWYEPFGRVAYEAALAGKHVLVSGRGGLPEAIADYPNAHVIDTPSDPAAWRDAIERVVGRQPDVARWAGHPDPVERYEALYRELIDSR